MTLITLSDEDYQRLLQITLSADDAKKVRRAQALLWLSKGEDVQAVANRLWVDRRTVYRWLRRFCEREALSVAARVADNPRSGRPKTAQGIIDPLILEVLEEEPGEFGYPCTIWTAPLLRQYLWDVHHFRVSQRSVHRALQRLDMVWKRPRYTLARRSATWRQAKGG